jgi:hypothetical protein
MAIKRSADAPETSVLTPAVALSEPLVVGQSATATLTGGPPDAEVTFSLAPPDGGVSEWTVLTDDQGQAVIDVVPATTGTMAVAVTQTSVDTLASAEAEVSGSAAAEAFTLTGIDPTESVVGPPDSVLLTITGTGFDINTRASFGVFSPEEAEAGAGMAGEPKWEATTRYVSSTVVTLDITQGLFPNPDPDIPVSVGKPDGSTAGPASFAFTPDVSVEPQGEESNG